MILSRIVQCLAVAVRVFALLTCLLMALYGYPPAKGQQPQQQNYFRSSESAIDQVQDKQIEQLNQHLSHTDGMLDASDRRVHDVEMTMSEMSGEARGAFVLLTLLTSGSLFLQVKMRRNNPEK